MTGDTQPTGPRTATESATAAEPAARPPLLAAGEVLSGRYRILGYLARGGMGEVYAALDLELRVKVALKTIRGRTSRPDLLERFRREVLLARAVASPHVCRVFDLGRHQDGARDVTFLTMELLAGETLAERIRKAGPLRSAKAMPLLRQMAEALRAAHQAGVVHRDFKSSNVMLVGEGSKERAVVTDFGLAAAVADEDDAGAKVAGTPHYMSPEQARGKRAGPRADIYALGVVLYEMVTGRLPFAGETPQDVIRQRLEREPPPARELAKDLDPRWDSGIERCLRRDPDERFASADEVVAAISGEELVHVRERRRRIRMWLAAALALAMAGAAALGYGAYRRQRAITQARDGIAKAEALARDGRYFEAHELWARARVVLRDDPALDRLAAVVVDDLTVMSEPAGARVRLWRLRPGGPNDVPDWRTIGTTPVEHVSIPRAEYLLAVDREGFAPFESTLSSEIPRIEAGVWGDPGLPRRLEVVQSPSGEKRLRIDSPAPLLVEVKLLAEELVPAGMVHVPGGTYQLQGWDAPTVASVRLDDYFIDRHEVTNREYARFAPRHAPAPGDRPVTGVTWDEAQAYCRSLGKDLPTAYQWEKAARGASAVAHGFAQPWGIGGAGEVVQDRANFQGDGTREVGSYPFGTSPYGGRDMAGNVSEWLQNPTSQGHAITGGSWSDLVYQFGTIGNHPGHLATPTIGFRCVKNDPGASGDQGGFLLDDATGMPRFEPVSDAEYQALLRHYRYDLVPLEPELVAVEETAEWRMEKVTIWSAGERIPIYLWLPRGFAPPHPPIQYDPSSASYAGATIPEEVAVTASPLIRSGRAVLVVANPGTRDRMLPPDYEEPDPASVRYRDDLVRTTIDERRGVDYLETRPDIDVGKLGYYSVSGGGRKLVRIAVEERFRSILMMGFGLGDEEIPAIAEANGINFARHIRAPKLLLNGRFDEAVRHRVRGEALLAFLAEPKRKLLVDDGHFPTIDKWEGPVVAWFDETLGKPTPARER